MSYNNIRLETPGGDTVCYFAPAFELTPQSKNDAHTNPRPTGPAIARNMGLWTTELVAQGEFVHSEDVPPDFRDALQSLHNQSTVTPTDQVLRLDDYTTHASSHGAYYLYYNDRTYRAETESELDVANGEYPAVVPLETRVPEQGEVSGNRIDYLVRFAVGLRGGSQDPTQP
jgi:hypothetical protein